jgi:D-aminoacyl-tRNA deacylase
MRAVIQCVKKASVSVNGKIISQIGRGMVILFAVHVDDTEEKITKLADKILKLRIFPDPKNKMKMDQSVKDINGEILVVSQFTLYGDTTGGNRPSFLASAKTDKALPFYQKFVKYLGENIKTETGEFGALMEVELVNYGPTTIIIDL